MKVLITGGTGIVGKETTARLVRNGWEVRVIGLETGLEIPGAEFVTCDIMNYDALREQIRGCEGVIHLAAIRGPQLALGHKVFEINAAGTFNVFEAAAAEGIRRVVQASSINAVGCAYSLTDIFPKYFPIDEDHPTLTNDPYSFSKGVIEDIGQYYWRRDGISSVALRFPWVYPASFVADGKYPSWRQKPYKALDDLLVSPENERAARLTAARNFSLEIRKTRPLEYTEAAGQPKSPYRDDMDPLWHAYNSDRFNFWAFVDERDAAQSLEKGLTASYDGAHALFINDDHNWLNYDSETLVRLFYPEVKKAKIKLLGSSSLVSIDQARRLIGFEPEHSVATLL